MKKQNLVFPQRGTLPKMNSRNFPHTRIHGIAAYKSDGGEDDDEDKEERKKLLKVIGEQMDVRLETRADKKEFKSFTDQFKNVDIEALRSIADPEKGAMAVIKNMGEEINRLTDELKKQPENGMSLRSQIANWQKANKDAIERIKGGTPSELKPLDIDMRAAGNMLVSTNMSGSSFLPQPGFLPGVNDVVRVLPTFWDYLKKGRTTKAALVWVNKVNPDGAASFVGEGVARTAIDFDLQTETSNAKKIAEKLKTSTEILEDIDGMETMVLDEMRYKLLDKLNTELMTSTLSSTKVAGIQTFSVVFSQTGLKVKNPNNMDCIRAGVAQLRRNNFRGLITAFVSPIDNANIDMSKATASGVYVLPPFSTSDGKNIGGAVVVEDNNVADGYVQFAVLDELKMLIYKDMTINMGWENTDFTDGLITWSGEMRIHSFHSNNAANAFIYDTFENIKGLIADAS